MPISTLLSFVFVVFFPSLLFTFEADLLLIPVDALLQVRKQDFLHVVQSVRRRITPEMVQFFEEWRDGSGTRSA
jgi:hypothetical protein